MKKFSLSFIFLLSIFVCQLTSVHAAFFDTGWSVRAVGLGGAYCAIAEGPDAPSYNVAGIAQSLGPEGQFAYIKPFVGLDKVDLGFSYASCIVPTGKIGALGLSWESFASPDLYREDAGLLSFASRLNSFFPLLIPEVSFGAGLKYLSHAFVPDEYTLHDDLFRAGRSKGAFSCDLGLLIRQDCQRKDGLSFGIAARNIIPADVGLSSKDIAPIQYRTGVAYNFGELLLLEQYIIEDAKISLDFSRRGNDWHRWDDWNVHLGWEHWFASRTFGMRAGANMREAAIGIACNVSRLKPFDFGLDYTFVYPFQIQGTYGTHRVSVFIKAKGKPVQAPAPAKQPEVRQQPEQVKETPKEELLREFYYKGVELYNDMQYKEAIAQFKKILELEPNHQESLKRIKMSENMLALPESERIMAYKRECWSRGMYHYEREEYKEAAKEFERILKVDPNHEQSRRLLGECRKKM